MKNVQIVLTHVALTLVGSALVVALNLATPLGLVGWYLGWLLVAQVFYRTISKAQKIMPLGDPEATESLQARFTELTGRSGLVVFEAKTEEKLRRSLQPRVSLTSVAPQVPTGASQLPASEQATLLRAVARVQGYNGIFTGLMFFIKSTVACVVLTAALSVGVPAILAVIAATGLGKVAAFYGGRLAFVRVTSDWPDVDSYSFASTEQNLEEPARA